jgi:UDP-hydrolysing UDP-N-acetyl-D-glucosamine 2-epimerase
MRANLSDNTMSQKRKACVILVDRANYGRLKPVMRAIANHPELQLQTIAAGTMVLNRFGRPVDTVREDGFPVDGEVYLELEGNTPATMAKSLGFGVVEFTNEYMRLAPDIVVLIGDRYEALAAAIAAAYMNICILHLQGGEVSGSIDESARHAITKFAQYHFPSTERSARYLVRMGEDPQSILGIGCPSSDIASELDLSLSIDLLNGTGSGAEIDPEKPFLLVVFHPITTEYGSENEQMQEILASLSVLQLPTVLLWPNIDAGADRISKSIRIFRERKSPEWLRILTNLPPEGYLTVLGNTACAVGNSSSFVRDAGYFGTPVVLVGDRQEGREVGDHVAVCNVCAADIVASVRCQLEHGRYPASSLYGDGGVSARVADMLSSVRLYTQKRLRYVYEEEDVLELISYDGTGSDHRSRRIEGHSEEEHRSALRKAAVGVHR